MPHEQNDRSQRRGADDHREPTMYDIWSKLTDIEQRQINHASAFLTNDLGKPDYEGHRQSHRAMVKNAEALESYKTDATKRVIGVVIGVLVTLLGAGLLSWLQKGL